MNTAIYTQSMGSQGVGFAMPSNIIANVYNMLIGPDHKVVRGSIGISFQAATSSAVGRVYGFKNGVIVSTITPAEAPPRPESSLATSSSPSTAARSRTATIWSTTSPPARSAATVKLGYLRDGKQERQRHDRGPCQDLRRDRRKQRRRRQHPAGIRCRTEQARHHRLRDSAPQWPRRPESRAVSSSPACAPDPSRTKTVLSREPSSPRSTRSRDRRSLLPGHRQRPQVEG